MATVRLVPKRSGILLAVQWVGNNFAEAEAFYNEYFSHLTPLVDNEDGTLTTGLWPHYTLQTGDWLAFPSGILFDADKQAGFQETPGVGA